MVSCFLNFQGLLYFIPEDSPLNILAPAYNGFCWMVMLKSSLCSVAFTPNFGSADEQWVDNYVPKQWRTYNPPIQEYKSNSSITKKLWLECGFLFSQTFLDISLPETTFSSLIPNLKLLWIILVLMLDTGEYPYFRYLHKFSGVLMPYV